MENTTNPRQEHERNKRRRRRQLLGAVLSVVLLVGVATLVRYAISGVAALFDDTDKKLAYEQKLQALVMLDPLPFEGIDKADTIQFKEYAIWATVFKAQRTPTGLDAYERDPDTGAAILPTVEIDATLAALLGPDYKITHGSFESSDMNFFYDEEKQAYYVPVTGQTGQYNTSVVKLHKKDGKLIVTVGYVPTASMSEFALITPTEPTKYMEYIFEKTDKEYYLCGLQASEMKVVTSGSTSTLQDPDVDYDYDPTSILAGNAELDDSGAEGSDSNSSSEGDEPSSAAE